MKTCFKCGVAQPLDCFYSHPQMADGYLNKCKECTKADTRGNYRARWEAKRAYDKARNQRPSRRAAKAEYHRRANPQKQKARRDLKNAVRDRRVLPQPCEVCGDLRVEGHHTDYSKPFDVRWLCFRHHREVAHGQHVGIDGNDWRTKQPF